MGKKVKYIGGNLIEFEILKLVDKYDPILTTPTQDIDFEVMKGMEVASMSMSLMETLNKMNALGLAANQVGLKYSMFALNVGKQIMGFINPKILAVSETKSDYKEGCLSFPGLLLSIKRPEWVEIEFYGVSGEKREQRFDGLTATVIQHEIDHLRGIRFVDLVPKMVLEREKAKIKSNMRKMKRMTAA